MKQKIIRLTESDVREIIKNCCMRYLKEDNFGLEDDRFEEENEPWSNSLHFWYNPKQGVVNYLPHETMGTWYNVKIDAIFVGRPDDCQLVDAYVADVVPYVIKNGKPLKAKVSHNGILLDRIGEKVLNYYKGTWQ